MVNGQTPILMPLRRFGATPGNLGIGPLIPAVPAPTTLTPVVCTPAAASLTLSLKAPTVLTPVVCTPSKVALTTTLRTPKVYNNVFSTAIAWLKANAGVYKDGGSTLAVDGDTVQQWNDQNGSNNATQATSGLRAVYKTGIINGLPVIRFDATVGEWYDLPNFLSSLTEGEVFIVFKRNADPPGVFASTGLWQFGGSASDTHVPYTDGVVYEDFGTDTRKTTGNPTDSLAALTIYNVSSKAGEWTVRINGVQHYTTATNTVAFTTTPRLGRALGNDAFMDGDVGEMLVFPAVLNGGTDRSQVYTYLDGKWRSTGTTVTPGKTALTLSLKTPTVLTPVVCTPGKTSLVLSLKSPTVLTPVVCTPGKTSLVITARAPTVLAPRLCTPAKATLVLSLKSPTVLTPVLCTPPKTALTLSLKAPVVTTGSIQSATPGKLTLTLTRLAPTVTTTDFKTVTPGKATLIISPKAVAVVISNNKVATPPKTTLTLTRYAPLVTPTQNMVVVPLKLTMAITAYAPAVVASGGFPGRGVRRLDHRIGRRLR